jgi:hypothetical protein
MNLLDMLADIKPVEKPARATKMRTPKTSGTTDAEVTALTPKSTEFINIRHLVEYLIVKNPEIRFEQIERIVASNFDREKIDTGLFMWIKLDIKKNNNIEFRKEIGEQLAKEEKESETKSV